jgi:hypothetical protein
MKGLWTHFAASAAITAVFVVCALALSVSAVPVSTPAVEASQVEQTTSFSASFSEFFARLAEAEGAPAAAPAPAPAEPVAAAVTATQPAPAAAVAQPAAQPDPAPAAPQPEDPVAQPAKKPPPPDPVINPPTNLVGEFVPDLPPYVELTWNPNNSNRDVDYFLVYKEDVAQPGQVHVAQSRKADYGDYDITLGHTYRYWVTAVAKWGEESGPSNVIEVETQQATPPAPPQGVVAAAIDPGVSLDWQPNSESNLAGYNVYLLLGSGRWRQLNKDVVTDTHYYFDGGAVGETYAVCAVNDFGIESGYTTVVAQPSTPVIYEDDDSAITVTGLWVYEKYLGASGGQIRVAGDAGARLNFVFTGRQVKLIAANYWTCGNARIYIDGTLMATISMYSFDPVFQSVDISVPGLKYGNHTLTIEVVGAGNPETEFNFVNVDAFEVR